MKEYITPYDIANTVRMMLSQRPGAFVIVEGDTDARVYGRFVDMSHCEVIPAHGKDNVLIAMKLLEKGKNRGVLAIVDSDFWKLEDVTPDMEQVMVTDTHDLETMILSSQALDVVLREFGAARKIEKIGKPVREALLDAGLPIGYFRWISSSKMDNLLLNFSKLKFSSVVMVHGKMLYTDIDSLIREVKKGSLNAVPDSNKIKDRLRSFLKDTRHDPWQVCSGHDLVHILTIGLREAFGGRSARNMTYEIIDRILRIAYTHEEFSKTELYASIKGWEKNNKGYTVLRILH